MNLLKYAYSGCNFVNYETAGAIFSRIFKRATKFSEILTHVLHRCEFQLACGLAGLGDSSFVNTMFDDYILFSLLSLYTFICIFLGKIECKERLGEIELVSKIFVLSQFWKNVAFDGLRFSFLPPSKGKFSKGRN
jgi:hypothetical protein